MILYVRVDKMFGFQSESMWKTRKALLDECSTENCFDFKRQNRQMEQHERKAASKCQRKGKINHDGLFHC